MLFCLDGIFLQKMPMTKLEAYLHKHIEENGPIDTGTFMGLALGHLEWGYYMRKDPLGVAGDFTTAPEISQMFGEIIGAWLVDTWIKLGKPDPFLLIECGPGRGTLMEDALRATKQVEGFHGALKLFLIETSPVLQEKQKEKLGQYNPQWLDSIDHPAIRPSGHPLILIANEFLDALPVRQLQMTNSGWQERVVAVNGEGLTFNLSPAPAELIPQGLADTEKGNIFEISPARCDFVQKLCGLISQNGGVSLFIDYGHTKSAAGDTFQAVKNHEYVSVLSHIGEADLTAHVDFEALARIADQAGILYAGPVEQGIFLQRLGIAQRAEILSQNASGQQREEIKSACARLCDAEQMGNLFKVMAFYYNKSIGLAGF